MKFGNFKVPSENLAVDQNRKDATLKDALLKKSQPFKVTVTLRDVVKADFHEANISPRSCSEMDPGMRCEL